MWNLYSHPNSVAVRVNYNALIRSLESGEINLSYPSKNGLKSEELNTLYLGKLTIIHL